MVTFKKNKSEWYWTVKPKVSIIVKWMLVRSIYRGKIVIPSPFNYILSVTRRKWFRRDEKLKVVAPD